jgi:hypothetical protein
MLEYYDDHKTVKAEHKDSANPIWSRKEVQPVEFALQCVKTTLEALVDRFKPPEVRLYLTGPGNFRETVAVTKPYKGNRLEAKPKHFNAVGEYLIKQWGAITVRGIEADDAIGIALSQLGDSAISVSTDKDLRQVPGWHYDWVKDEGKQVSKREGDFTLYTQILTGDTTDNVPGLPGCGEAGAREILDKSRSTKELQSRSWAAYRDSGKSLEYFLEQAELIYILREESDPWVANLEAHLKQELRAS